MSTSTRYVSDEPAAAQPAQAAGGESDIDAQTKANTLANAAATSSSPAPHILTADKAPKDEVAMHNTPTSASSGSSSTAQ